MIDQKNYIHFIKMHRKAYSDLQNKEQYEKNFIESKEGERELASFRNPT